MVVVLSACAALAADSKHDPRHRVIVSTDIGGTDPDDFQSLVHLLLYADTLEIEGLISSPFGPGRKDDIITVLDQYESDYDSLRAYSADYPEPSYLLSVTKQGETEPAPYQGHRRPTEGSNWLIQRAMADDPRPLHVLVWGGIEDLAQALHDEPDIVSRIRVYWIGGPNKKWSPDAYQYIATEHPDIQIIESNATYRGWFTGGNQVGKWGNERFVSSSVAGRGALGEFFDSHLGGVIKMGDSPSVGWLLNGTPGDPSKPGWGGRFVRAWARPTVVVDRLTTTNDTIEEFGIFELVLPVGADASAEVQAQMVIDNQALAGHFDAEGNVRFRFSPKGAKEYSYRIRSSVGALDGLSGELTALPTSPEQAGKPDDNWANWWTDDPDPQLAEGRHIGAKTVSRWREEFLHDFAERMARIEKQVAVADEFNVAMLGREAEWYSSAEARMGADWILKYQSAEGAWPKNTNLFAPATMDEIAAIHASGRANTIDNDATTTPMRFLAIMYQATGDPRYSESFIRGLDYLLDAQFENGGWPQFYPLREGYFSHITFNDNAMINVMSLLREVAEGREPFAFVAGESRSGAARAVARGIKCILDTQIFQDGKPTVWAAQYDSESLKPAWARAYEPPSLSGNESVGIVRFLMGIENPSATVVAAVEGAVAWLRAKTIRGYRYERGRNSEGLDDAWVTLDSTGPPIWARFYELETNRPLFLGRDGVFRYSLAEIERERRDGYAYYGSWPESLLAVDLPRWLQERKPASR